MELFFFLRAALHVAVCGLFVSISDEFLFALLSFPSCPLPRKKRAPLARPRAVCGMGISHFAGVGPAWCLV
jgi:hypothetical protein